MCSTTWIGWQNVTIGPDVKAWSCQSTREFQRQVSSATPVLAITLSDVGEFARPHRPPVTGGGE